MSSASSNSLPSPRRRPVERFLGPDEAAGGPFALLGLNPHICTDELVLSALDRQIERVARHPECDTPEADEVRLALHAAAAQLLDPAVRKHLIARWSSDDRAPVALKDEPPGESPLAGAKVLEHDAILALGLYGGWNQQSLRRLLSIAHARGFNNQHVAATLQSLAAMRRGTASQGAAPPVAGRIDRSGFVTSAQPAPPPQPHPTSLARIAQPSAPPIDADRAPETEPAGEEPAPLPGFARFAIYAAVGLTALALCATVVYWIVKEPLPPVQVAAAPIDTSEGDVRAAPDEASAAAMVPPPPSPKPVRRLEPAALPQEIAACIEALDLDPAAAAERLGFAIDTLAANWTRLARGQGGALIACHDRIVEFLYLAGARQDVVTSIIARIAAGSAVLQQSDAASAREPTAQEILPAVWSVGMLMRLMRERDLPLPSHLAVESTLIAALGAQAPALESTFEAGASAALLRLPRLLTPRPPAADERTAAIRPPAAAFDAKAWSQWAEAVSDFAGADVARRDRMLLVGLETLLVKGPETNESRAAAEVVADLVVRLDWRARAGGDARRWLLRAFGDRLLTNADLHAVTSTLATRSAAEGIDLTMVLSTSASERVRADLRARYAAAWGVVDTISREESTLAWIQSARQILAETPQGPSEPEQLGYMVLLARVNEAAHWHWRGEQHEAANILDNLRGPIQDALRVAAPRTTLDQGVRSARGGWGERYLGARQSIRARRDLLDELLRSHGILGNVDAAVLVQEAVMGTPPEIRLQAMTAVRQYHDSPAVIKALLDRLPRIPRLASNATLIAEVTGRRLPPVRDDSWPLDARRALVERLTESVSSQGPMARIDALVALLAASYQSLDVGNPALHPVTGGSATGGAAAAHRAASHVWTLWRSAAEPLVPSVTPPVSLSLIERRRAGRMALARGPVQRFAADQVGICELMSYVVTCERPGRIEDIRQTMGRLAAERRMAQHIFEQLIAVEQAMLRLWLIRIEEDPA